MFHILRKKIFPFLFPIFFSLKSNKLTLFSTAVLKKLFDQKLTLELKIPKK
jgi:hypothetical protein